MIYVALLRGINVGGNNTIKMSELKACFEAQGYTDVRTYINSGNIIFSTDELQAGSAKTIEQLISDKFKLNIPVVVRSQTQISELARQIPDDWTNDKALRTDVLFLWQEVDYPDVLKEIKTNPDVDNLMYIPGAIIWNYDRANYSKTKMRDFIGSRVYKLMTARNVNTVRKLNDLMQNP
jgi:uncharacterized protein (DUF1697 family)